MKIFNIVDDARKLRLKKTLDKENHNLKDQHAASYLEQQEDFDSRPINLSNAHEQVENHRHLPSNNKRTVFFNDEIQIINHDQDVDYQRIQKIENSSKNKPREWLCEIALIDYWIDTEKEDYFAFEVTLHQLKEYVHIDNFFFIKSQIQ